MRCVPLLLLVLALAVGSAHAEPPNVGLFTAAAPLPIAQPGVAIATLRDGSALVVGNDADQVWRYDPAAGGYRALGPMHAAHPIAAVTRLADGRVLIVGTVSADDAVPAAEVFDPTSEAFTALTSVRVRRSQAQAILLLDGRVLIAMGVAPQPDARLTQQAELFDPRDNSFSLTGVMLAPRGGASVTRLGSGDVLIAGGTDNQTHVYATAEVYRVASGAFAATGPMTAYRVYHTASVLPDGSALLTGGFGNATMGVVGLSTGIVQATAERYDPVSNSFAQLAAHMTDSRQYHSGTVLMDGRVLLAGGQDDDTALVTQAEMFDPSTAQFTRVVAPMITPRIAHVAARLSDGSILLAGGMTYNSQQSAFIQTPAVERFSSDALFTNSFEP